MKAERITDKGRIVAAVLGALLLTLLCAYALWARPPEIQEEPAPTPTPTPTATAKPEPTPTPTPTPEPLPEGEAFPTERQDGVYTVLLVSAWTR